jgi:hypothetical protein
MFNWQICTRATSSSARPTVPRHRARESKDYNAFFAAIAASVKPTDAIDWLFTKDEAKRRQGQRKAALPVGRGYSGKRRSRRNALSHGLAGLLQATLLHAVVSHPRKGSLQPFEKTIGPPD